MLQDSAANDAALAKLCRWSNSRSREMPANRIAGVFVHFGELIRLLGEYGGPEK